MSSGPARDGRTRSELFRLARRVDWRFLLPGAPPRLVVRVGAPDDELDRALTSVFDSVIPLATVADLKPPLRLDLLVLRSSRISDAVRAAELLPPGAALYWETGRGPASRSLRKALEGAGLEDVRVYWHRPDFHNCLDIIPLEETGVLDHVLQRGGHGVLGEMRRAAGRWAKRLGQLDAVASGRSVLGRKSPASVDPAGISDQLRRLVQDGNRGDPACGALLMKTPRFTASAHALLFAFASGATTPALVAKIPRLGGHIPDLNREMANLRALQEATKGSVSGVPRLVPSPLPGLLETIVPGREIHPTRVRSNPGRYLDAVVGWLTDFHLSTCRRDPAPELWWTECVESPLRRLEALFPTSAKERQLIQQTRVIAEPLRDAGLPRVFEHGDLSAPNLLLDEAEVGVVDWEVADARGVPASDLFFFLAFVAFARARATSTPACREAFQRAFFGQEAWTRPWIDHYASQLGLDGRALPALFVLTWARTVLLRYAERHGAGAESADREMDTLRRWLRDHRYWALWEESLRSYREIGFGTSSEGTP